MPVTTSLQTDAETMLNDGWTQNGMMEWSDVWHWVFSFYGILSIVSLTIIVIVGIALFRDWHRARAGGLDISKLGRE